MDHFPNQWKSSIQMKIKIVMKAREADGTATLQNLMNVLLFCSFACAFSSTSGGLKTVSTGVILPFVFFDSTLFAEVESFSDELINLLVANMINTIIGTRSP